MISLFQLITISSCVGNSTNSPLNRGSLTVPPFNPPANNIICLPVILDIVTMHPCSYIGKGNLSGLRIQFLVRVLYT